MCWFLGHLDRVLQGMNAEDVLNACDENTSSGVGGEGLGLANPAVHLLRGLRSRNISAIRHATQVSQTTSNKHNIYIWHLVTSLHIRGWDSSLIFLKSGRIGCVCVTPSPIPQCAKEVRFHLTPRVLDESTGIRYLSLMGGCKVTVRIRVDVTGLLW